uniref:RNA-directed DNA polymerase n=1 Tax=Panagrellus redivivus TaxID=6233 RepID=A0A7E5A243_PANRE
MKKKKREPCHRRFVDIATRTRNHYAMLMKVMTAIDQSPQPLPPGNKYQQFTACFLLARLPAMTFIHTQPTVKKTMQNPRAYYKGYSRLLPGMGLFRDLITANKYSSARLCPAHRVGVHLDKSIHKDIKKLSKNHLPEAPCHEKTYKSIAGKEVVKCPEIFAIQFVLSLFH